MAILVLIQWNDLRKNMYYGGICLDILVNPSIVKNINFYDFIR